ncbi:hypothetical protein Bca101_066753 [Brassica carinata]
MSTTWKLILFFLSCLCCVYMERKAYEVVVEDDQILLQEQWRNASDFYYGQ